jgi:dihydrofolate reductase
MSKVFVSVTVSLDGFIAPEQRYDDPGDQRWMAQWMALQGWVFEQKFFRENLKLGEGGLTGDDNRVLEQTFQRTGVTIMGKRMFDGGERHWPEEAPFHTPVFVLTRQKRDPWERKGGTTFYFVNDGLDSALDQARKVCGDRDIRIAGGAQVIRAYLNSGLVDELHLVVSPVFFGRGVRLFDEDATKVSLTPLQSAASPQVTHLRYAVRPKG